MRLILGVGGNLADEEQVADFFRFSAKRGIPIDELRVWEAGGAIRWAVLPIVNPGRTMLLLGAAMPRDGKAVTPAASITLCGGVLDLCREFRGRGVQLAQVLLDPADVPTLGLYGQCGFERMAELLYLHRVVRRPPKVTELPAGFAVRTYTPALHAEFAAAILASYEQSLDCPALNGRRHIDDVIAGHQASGDFDPAGWFLLTRDGTPSGVLLLNRSGAVSGVELVYLGLAPPVRGMGIGQHLMCFTQAWMHEQKLMSLTLAVDSINTPALRLYHRHGLQRVLSKIAMMRDL